MKAVTGYLALAMSVLLLGAAESRAAEPSETEAAQTAALEAATSWLELVDQAKWGESWEHAAIFFRGAVSKQDWERSVAGVRSPLGRVVSRTVKTKQYATSLPGAPDGEYVVLQFESSFENKAKAIETVTPMKDPDGVWRVSGYYIR